MGDEEYNEDKPKASSQNRLDFNEFDRILDNHINEMETRKKYGKETFDDALDTTSSNRKNKKESDTNNKKSNKEEKEFDNMLQNMMGGALSDDEEEDINMGE